MGVDLNIWSNHDIKWSKSLFDIVEQLEERVNSKIKFYDFKEKKKFGEKKLFGDIEYFMYKNDLESRFKSDNVSLLLDYEFLYSLNFHPTAIRLSPIRFYTKWHKWTSLVSKEYLKEEDDIERWDEFYDNWIKSHQFIKSIIALFGGDEIYYINDYAYESKEDLLYSGAEFKSIKNELEQIGKSHKLTYLIKNHKEVCSMNNWFFEQISNKSLEEFKYDVIKLLNKRKNLIDNDPEVYQVWDRLTPLLSNEIELTNKILMQDEFEIISFISEVMEEVYFKTNNKIFLKRLLYWENKYPNLKLQHNIESLIEIKHET
jgi:hypothetical protein